MVEYIHALPNPDSFTLIEFPLLMDVSSLANHNFLEEIQSDTLDAKMFNDQVDIVTNNSVNYVVNVANTKEKDDVVTNELES